MTWWGIRVGVARWRVRARVASTASRRQSVGEQDRHAVVPSGRARERTKYARKHATTREKKNNAGLKLSQEPGKTTIPGAKACYRLVGARGQMLLDLLVPAAHAAPEVGERVLCRHPFDSSKRAYVTPSRVLELHAPVFEGGRRVGASEDLRELRAYCQRQLGEVREDVLRPLNPTPYKTSVSAELFSFLQDALQRHQPITELT